MTEIGKRLTVFGVIMGVVGFGLPTGLAAAEQTAVKRPGRLSAVVFPLVAQDRPTRELAFGIADRAGAELLNTGSYNHFHLKQVLRFCGLHGIELDHLADPQVIRRALGLLGAKLAVFGSIEKAGAFFELRILVLDLRSDKQAETKLKIDPDPAKAVEAAGRAVAQAVAKLDGVALSAAGNVQPASKSGSAMRAYLACSAVLIEQPMGLRKSFVLDPKTLALARAECERAVKLDPNFFAAWASLSLAQSLALKPEEASRALVQAEKAKGYSPFGQIARYWLATRFSSSDDGARVLRAAVGEHPGALIFQTYLGEHLNITKRYDQALVVWKRYLQRVPNSPFALARQGYSQARLGQLSKAIASSEMACKLDPESLDLKLELASRLVDAGKLGRAEKVLLPMANNPRVYGEVLLRLGYVYLLQNKNEEAKIWLDKALALAKGPNEWRTRGRTRYDLAIIMARRDALAEAEQHLLAAAEEGFMVRELLQKNVDLQRLASRRRVAHLFKSPKLKVEGLLLHASPFPVTQAGEADPDAKRPALTGFTF